MANYEVLEPGGHAALIDGLKDYTDREGGVGAEQIADGSVNLDKLGDDVLDELDSKAYADGYYAQLTAGAADNLTARGDAVEASFIRRTSGGINDIESGNATIESINGNTVRWNQLAPVPFRNQGTSYGITYTPNSDGSMTLSGTATQVARTRIGTITTIVGHKYAVYMGGTIPASNDVYVYNDNGGIVTNTSAKVIATATAANSVYVRIASGAIVDGTLHPQLFDLTAMFGAGNEPETVAEFEALYPEPYYAYDAGSLKPVKLNGIETTGFNQWDVSTDGEQYEGHYYIDGTAGGYAKTANSNYNCYCVPVFPSTEYCLSVDTGNIGQVANRCYLDANKQFISGSVYGYGSPYAVFTTPANARYVELAVSVTSTKKVCINLSWSGRRNGEYEPYWKAERLIAAGTHFPTGLKSAGTVYDELTADEAIQRVGEVDLGTLTWTASATGSTGKYRMISNGLRSLIAKPASSAVLGNMTCQKYDSLTSGQVYQLTTGISVAADGDLVVYDPSYEAADSAAAFKTAMSGVMLHYALATPTTTTIDPALNLTYKVDDWGTESVMVPSATVSAVPTFGIVYGMNAVDTIRRLPDLYAGKAETEAALAGKADVDGYYSQMTVGAADNLTGRGDTATASFLYRTAGGTADIETGQAVAKSVKGNTLVWNQLCTGVNDRQTIDGLMFSQSETGGLNVSGTITTAPSNNRMYISNTLTVKRDGRKYLCMLSKDIGIDIFLAGFTTSNQRRAFIFSNNYNGETIQTAIAIVVHDGDAFDLFDVHASIFDLTAMFGAGNEPSTVAEFEALYPLPYYEYDAGSLLSVNMEGIETVGFNQWDEEWELGTINANDGTNVLSNSMIRSKNYIPVFSGQTYYFRGKAYFWAYAADKSYVGRIDHSGAGGTSSVDNNTITIPDGTCYLRFVLMSAYGTTYNNDICINLSWSGRRNGEYEPYWSAQRLIDAATYFPDGMRSAGTVYDELTETAAITRVGEVDLGTLTWTAASSDNIFYASPTNMATPSTGQERLDGIACSKYAIDTVLDIGDVMTDGTIKRYNGRVYIKDTSYTDAATFKTAMSGVMLHYALATPTVTPIDPALNLSYRVDDFGTERVMVPEDERSAPPVLDIAYGLNVVDFVRRAPSEYISHASMSQFRLALMAHLGVFINETWDEVDNRYEYTITSE